MMSNFSSR